MTRTALLDSVQRANSSLSWRITRPLRSLRRLLLPSAIPISSFHAVTPLAIEGGEWVARGVCPQLVAGCVPLQGWIRVDLDVESPLPTRAHLYWDTGGLYNEGEHYDLGAIDGRTRRSAVLHLERPVFSFRFDPVRIVGKFKIHAFSITPLSGLAIDALSLRKRYTRAREGGPLWTSIRNCALMLVTGDWANLRGKWRAVMGVDASPGADYRRWREAHALTPEKRDELKAAGRAGPLISVLMPTYNTPETLLREGIDSVINQTYQNWELCIADDASPLPHVKKILSDYAKKDSRIRVTFREKNGHIAAASNTALEMARGEFIALLDHDDMLAEHALSAVAAEVKAHPQTDMIYSDEDKVTMGAAGTRNYVDPFFKPDWSPEYFLACMYTCHLGVYRTSLVREIGGFRSEFDQAQDYDLVLRLTRRTRNIRHIPDILYHWRVTPESTAGGADAKPTAHLRAQAALRDHVKSLGGPGEVTDGPAAGFHRVRFAVRGEPKVTIAIPSACRKIEFGGKETYWAVRCAESLRAKATYKNVEIVVAGPPEGGDETFEAEMKRLGVIRVSYGSPFNFSRACNIAAAAGTGGPADHILFLNDDTEVITPDFIEEMLSWSQQKEIGAVGARLMYPDHTLQHVGVTVLGGNPGHPFVQYPADHPGHFFSTRVHRNWSAVTAACVMVRREVFEAVGRFDEYFPINYNDTDFCLRIREAGYRIVSTPYAELVHHESVTRKVGMTQAELKMFHDRWLSRYPVDPYYNPNLSVTYGDFRIDV